MFHVEYELLDCRGNPLFVREYLHGWIESGLRDGGIEKQISKLQGLLAIMGEQWLCANPGRVDEIADVLGYDGMNYRVINVDEGVSNTGAPGFAVYKERS